MGSIKGTAGITRIHFGRSYKGGLGAAIFSVTMQPWKGWRDVFPLVTLVKQAGFQSLLSPLIGLPGSPWCPAVGGSSHSSFHLHRRTALWSFWLISLLLLVFFQL